MGVVWGNGADPVLGSQPADDSMRSHEPKTWLVFLEKLMDLRENFVTDASMDNKVPVNFWKSSRLRRLDSGVHIQIPDLNWICCGIGLCLSKLTCRLID